MTLNVDYYAADGVTFLSRQVIPDAWVLEGEQPADTATRCAALFGYPTGTTNNLGLGIALQVVPPDPPPPAPKTVPMTQVALFPTGQLPPGWTAFKGPVPPTATLQYAQFTG